MRAVLVVLVMLVMLPRGCDSGLLFGRACVAGARCAAARRAGLGATRAVLCAGSIGRACDSGMFTVTQLEYMRASRDSRDARDIIFHRAMMKMCAGMRKENACVAASIDATRRANNALIHVIEEVDALDAAMHEHMKTRRVRHK